MRVARATSRPQNRPCHRSIILGPRDHASQPMNILFSLCYWAFVAVTSIVLYPGAVLIWVLTAPFDPARS